MIISTPLQNDLPCPTQPTGQLYTIIEKEKSGDDLLYLLQQKTERGFARLYDNYADALFSILYKVVGNKEIAEDLLQETFIKIWKKIDQFDAQKATLFTWMLNIARNTGIDFMRSSKNKFHQKMVHADASQHEYFRAGTALENINRLDYLSVKNKAASLEDKYAVIIHLIYFEGFTYIQVARQLKMPLSTVKTRAKIALTLLKKAYNEYWGNY